jgi:spore germination protein KA
MFRSIKKIISHYKARNSSISIEYAEAQSSTAHFLSERLEENIKFLSNELGTSSDVIIRQFSFGANKQLNGALVLIDGLVNKDLIDMVVLQPLMYDMDSMPKSTGTGASSMDVFCKNLLSTCDAKKTKSLEDLIDRVLSGDTIFLLDGSDEALAFSMRQWDKRSVDEPATESVVRGPREGFTETLRTNTSLLRRKVKSPNLRFETMKVGEQTRTDVCIAYINGIVMPDLVEEIKSRLASIHTDSVLDSGYIEAFIEDAPYSIFSTVGSTERPDNTAAKILEGRAAIFVDGSPFVLTVPSLFIENFQSAEDYYIRPYYASILRVNRLISYIIAIMAPAVYVALTTYHQELIPTQLLFTMASGHSGIPFPSLVEAILMVGLFDILREAGVRLPRPIGSAVSIVGALVLGESAVSAGLIGPFMVIVVATTAITSFVVPSQTDSVTIIRYFLLILAGFLGGFGIVMGSLVVCIHLVSLYSFGVPYLTPIVPLDRNGLKDTFMRAPLLSMILRPKELRSANRSRRKPAPPRNQIKSKK